LREAQLRPTRQRLTLARILFSAGHRHVTAEDLHAEVMGAGERLSLATVYNTLHQFTRAGLLRPVIVDGERIHFDTNTSDHHHFFVEDENELVDIPVADVIVDKMPSAPDGYEVARIDVVVRLRKTR